MLASNCPHSVYELSAPHASCMWEHPTSSYCIAQASVTESNSFSAQASAAMHRPLLCCRRKFTLQLNPTNGCCTQCITVWCMVQVFNALCGSVDAWCRCLQYCKTVTVSALLKHYICRCICITQLVVAAGNSLQSCLS